MASLISRKRKTDKLVKIIFMLITIFCASAIFAIIGVVLIKGIKPFVTSYIIDGTLVKANLINFLFGLSWEKTSTDFGIFFILINTFYITILSLIVSVPISVLTALFIVRIAPKWLSKILTIVTELLSSIPSIIYGLFGAGLITVMVSKLANIFNYQTAGGLSTLSTVIVLSMMIIPTITTISVTSIKSVKDDYIKGSLALGASPTQTNFKVVLVSAKSGIMSGVILGIGRALGEATAVSMVCGNAQQGPTFNIFDITRTLTSTMLSGLSESTGLKYDIRFSIAIVLLVLIIGVNWLLNLVKKRIQN
ncbi:MAG: phosphate ABC transporter permease subunit PstC [Traorella sp.]